MSSSLRRVSDEISPARLAFVASLASSEIFLNRSLRDGIVPPIIRVRWTL